MLPKGKNISSLLFFNHLLCYILLYAFFDDRDALIKDNIIIQTF